MISMDTATEKTITSAARESAQGWAEQAITVDPWTEAVPGEDLHWLESEVLGRNPTSEEEALFCDVFREEYNATASKLADLRG